MDIAIVIKTFIVGLIWTGSFYLIISYIYPIFPMPQLLWMRKMLEKFSDSIAEKNEKRGRWIWGLCRGLFKFITAVLWLLTMAVYLYYFIPVLQYYIYPNIDISFWGYYALAIALPALYILWLGISIFKKSKLTMLLKG